ncbi:MAG: hypothetical protein NC131_08815 [Roseburia sp.]|nr:hypothetical protein [Roseburia sp.]
MRKKEITHRRYFRHENNSSGATSPTHPTPHGSGGCSSKASARTPKPKADSKARKRWLSAQSFGKDAEAQSGQHRSFPKK